MLLLVPLLFSLCVSLLFWYFGAALYEKRMLNKRIRMLQEGVITTVADKGKLYKDDFLQKNKRGEKRQIENQPQFLMIAAVWLTMGAYILHRY